MKYLVCGLGNMGYEYNHTRHNIGFEVVDFLCQKLGGSWRDDHHGLLAEVKFKGRILILLKPNTYMNLSGKAVRYWLQKEKIEPGNLIVICDDLNLPFEKLRLRSNGSDGGHNGLKSINELLQTQDYPRLRVGIGANFSKGRQSDYVLGKWTADETSGLQAIIEKSVEGILALTTIGIGRAMNVVNS